ncbi:hypothetical protein UY3_11132 [Chelonia mydas]|uniref:Uncharacterized protein n=1 Tax=Chelonia mydas TaxID=8469 RepID=M7B876_CHEMY|nr:hypothetical protein UY3_11132 [Chelonia mydas]
MVIVVKSKRMSRASMWEQGTPMQFINEIDSISPLSHLYLQLDASQLHSLPKPESKGLTSGLETAMLTHTDGGTSAVPDYLVRD